MNEDTAIVFSFSFIGNTRTIDQRGYMSTRLELHGFFVFGLFIGCGTVWNRKTKPSPHRKLHPTELKQRSVLKLQINNGVLFILFNFFYKSLRFIKKKRSEMQDIKKNGQFGSCAFQATPQRAGGVFKNISGVYQPLLLISHIPPPVLAVRVSNGQIYDFLLREAYDETLIP